MLTLYLTSANKTIDVLLAQEFEESSVLFITWVDHSKEPNELSFDRAPLLALISW